MKISGKICVTHVTDKKIISLKYKEQSENEKKTKNTIEKRAKTWTESPHKIKTVTLYETDPQPQSKEKHKLKQWGSFGANKGREVCTGLELL